jgi:hypothetical protein
MAPPLVFDVLSESLAICRLAAAEGIPGWVFGQPGFWSVSRRGDEISVIGPGAALPSELPRDAPWRALSLRGPLEMTMTGVTVAFATPLAAARIPIMPIATYETDVVLVREDDLQGAVDALRRAGFVVAG